MPLSPAARDAVNGLNTLTDEDKKEAARVLQVANPEIFPQNDKDRMVIWLAMVIGMFVLAVAAVVASTILALNKKDFSAVIALGTAVVGGLFGLFAKGPTSD
jgi:hypothetical protein